MSFACVRLIIAGWLVGVLMIPCAARAQTPAGPSSPAAPPAGEPKKPEEPVFRFKPVFDAVMFKLESKDWLEQRRILPRKEIVTALGDEVAAQAKELAAAMTNIEALSANNHFTRQLCLVQVIAFKKPEQAVEYLELAHRLTKKRLEKEAKRNEEYGTEVRDDRLQILGPDQSKRLVMITREGPRSGQLAVDRFVKGSIFVEVSVVAKSGEESVDIRVSEVVFREIRSM